MSVPMSTTPRPNPELMVIGDSLAQGCRSLSVMKDYCAQSWGAQIARSQGWTFVAPDMPRPILFDLEQEIRRINILSVALALVTFEGIIDRLKQNQNAWFHSTPSDSQYECFDNLGLAGALVCDLYQRTSATSQAEINGLSANGTQPVVAPANIGDLQLAINGWFTLNPSHNPEWQDYTPLKWVEVRQPKRLVVQIGHNHGLFQFGFEAQTVGDPYTGLTQKGTAPFQQQPDDYWIQWQKVADALAALPRSIETIVVVLLPKVGAVASLEPGSDKRVNSYSDFYEPAFIPTPNVLSRDQVEAADETIRTKINAQIQKIVTDSAKAAGTDSRLKFLDTWALFDADDYKNTLQATRRVRVDTNHYIDNRYLHGTPPLVHLPWLPGNRLAAGGFLSVDGMHPSGAGYAVLAGEVMKLLGLKYDPSDLLQTAFNDDKLLSQYPVELDYLGSALHLLRTAQHANHFIANLVQPLDDNSHLVSILHAMTSVFHP
jgi:lysophospholipase L1-like esterase